LVSDGVPRLTFPSLYFSPSLPRKKPRIYRIENWEAKKIISGAAGNRNVAAHPAVNN
jgi:hypothetical protein